MLAYTVRNGVTTTIDVDVGEDDVPLLPYNSTVTPPPEAEEGKYVALVDSEWVQIPITIPFFEQSYLVQLKLQLIQKYAEWYYSQPVTFDGHSFQTDNESKNLLIQAYNIFKINGYLPPAWITSDNQQYAITTEQDLTGIITSVASIFSSRFFEIQVLKAQTRAATTQEELDAVVVPSIPNQFGF